MLPVEVIETDHAYEAGIEQYTDQLARHRWHWTLDESNPGRESIREYARQAGHSESTIRVMVNGYAASLRDASRTLADHIGKARMSGETAAAAEAVAQARGQTVRGVADPGAKHHNEVRRVRDIARQLAEEHGTSVEEEASKVAETIVRHEQAEQEERQQKAQRTDLRIIEAEQQGLIAKRALLKMIKALDGVDDSDDFEILISVLDGVKAALALCDVRLSGKSGVDWDAELARLA